VSLLPLISRRFEPAGTGDRHVHPDETVNLEKLHRSIGEGAMGSIEHAAAAVSCFIHAAYLHFSGSFGFPI
jgi:hypothetical protein